MHTLKLPWLKNFPASPLHTIFPLATARASDSAPMGDKACVISASIASIVFYCIV